MTNKTYNVRDTFKLNVPEQMGIQGNATPCPFTPRIDMNYLFRKEFFRDYYAWHVGGVDDALMIFGPPGVGKTSFIKQFHAVLNLPMQYISGNKRTEPSHLIGQFQLINGDTIWVDGPLTMAMRLGQTFMLGEGDLVRPECNSVLHAVAEGYPLVLAANGGEVVQPEKGFRIVIDGNTNGQGDPLGAFGSQRQSMAFMDRFWVLEWDYMSKQDEVNVLKSTFKSFSVDILGKMVDVANDIRKLYMGVNDSADAIDITFSTRTILRWARLTQMFKDAPNPVGYALNIALLNRASPESAATIKGVVQRHFGDNENAAV